MDIHTDSVVTALSYDNAKYSQAEDSGYHTFTPGSFDSPEISRDIFNASNLVTTITGQIQIECHVTPDIIQLHHRYNNCSTLERSVNTPPFRRALKRSYSISENGDVSGNSVPTPTSFIAGKIQSLHFHDAKEVSNAFKPETSYNLFHQAEGDILSQYPTTPVKNKCKGPCKRSSKKLDFTTHSLLCESKGLQINKSNKKSVKKPRIPSKARTNLFKCNTKLDIISRLHEECGTGPPIMKILSFVSCEDILNFNLVSRRWNDVWESISEDNEMKQKYRNYLRIAKENQENKQKGITPKRELKLMTVLKEIQNDIKDNKANVLVHSPPGTPRSNKFKKFAKSASLDSRKQMTCVRCEQPGKVTEETSGEVWVQCTSSSCAYKFCKHCICDRHPGKPCFRYDLEGPSPSKRKKSNYGVCSKKSKRNLHRLL